MGRIGADIPSVGCFFGSILSAIFGEQLGRRRTIAHGCWIMIVGAVLQASSYGRAQLIVGRVVSGVGLGIINSTVPVLQAEFSPKATRGVCKLYHPSVVVERRLLTRLQTSALSCRP